MIFKGEKLYGFSHHSGAKASSKPAFRGSAFAPFLHSLRSFRNGFAAPTIRRKRCRLDAAGGPHWYVWSAILRVTSGDCAGVARKLLYQHALACCKSGARVTVRTQPLLRTGTLGAQFPDFHSDSSICRIKIILPNIRFYNVNFIFANGMVWYNSTVLSTKIP